MFFVLLQVRETYIHNSLAGIKLTANKRLPLGCCVCCCCIIQVCCSPAGCLYYCLGCSRSLQAGGPPASADACLGLSRGKLVILFPSLMYNASVYRLGLLSLNEAHFYWMRRHESVSSWQFLWDPLGSLSTVISLSTLDYWVLKPHVFQSLTKLRLALKQMES